MVFSGDIPAHCVISVVMPSPPHPLRLGWEVTVVEELEDMLA